MKEIILIGAGEAGNIVLNHQSDFGFKVKVWLDDDVLKHSKMRKVAENVGRIDSLPKYIQSYDTVIVAIATASRGLLRRIKEMCGEKQLLVMPPVYLQLKDLFPAEPLRPYGIEDLLARPKRKIDLSSAKEQIKESTILIAGAAGSIGGELAKLVTVFGCKKLMLVDIDENGLEEIRMRLQRGSDIKIESHLCDLKNLRHLRRIFESRPDIVFNCAAHKHVSSGQRNPSETVHNNLVSTKNLLECCALSGTKRFIFISTDKSVEPTSVMGASKTLCESLILSWKKNRPERYIVRFGNVLNSQGSVLRVWEDQLSEGFVLTVTDPKMERYVMSISEACQLILKSIEFAPGTYILDMGPQITVNELLDAFLKAHEKTRDEIRIKRIGKKSGEKLVEELFWPQEVHKRTQYRKIFSVENTPVFHYERSIGISGRFDDLAVMSELKTLFPRLKQQT